MSSSNGSGSGQPPKKDKGKDAVAPEDPESFYKSGIIKTPKYFVGGRGMMPQPLHPKLRERIVGSVAAQRSTNEKARQAQQSISALGSNSWELQATRLSMARLLAAKVLVEQAYEYAGLNIEGMDAEDQPLYPFSNQLQEARHLMSDALTRLGNSGPVKNYEKAYTIPERSPWYGKGFNQVVPADVKRMLAGVPGVVEDIVREIE